MKPGVEAFAVFREVQLRVKDTMHQEPMSLNYIPRIYLAAEAPEPAAPGPAAQPALSEAAWRILRETGSEAELEAFIKRFGETAFCDFARARLAEVKRQKIAKPKPVLEAPKPAPAAIRSMRIERSVWCDLHRPFG